MSQDQFSNQFDKTVVRTHSETYSTGNSPLDQKSTRTNVELTTLMSQYISETEEHEELDNQARDAYRVMSDFMMYLAYQDVN